MASSSLKTQSGLRKDISGDVRLYACNKLRITGWIMSFVVDVVPFEANKNRIYKFPVFGNTKKADAKVAR
jgi:hypothetical protein